MVCEVNDTARTHCMVDAHIGILYQISEKMAFAESSGILPLVTGGSLAQGLKVSGRP